MLQFRHHTIRLFGAAVLAGCLGIGGTSTRAFAITEQEAQDIAVEAYLYFYPIVSFDVTRKQFTNLEPDKIPGRGPINMFHNVPAYPPGDDKGVVRYNFDTLYSSAFLDLTEEPVVLSVPASRWADRWTDPVRVVNLSRLVIRCIYLAIAAVPLLLRDLPAAIAVTLLWGLSSAPSALANLASELL